MNKLEQLHLFLRFHFAPETTAKSAIWEDCCSDPYTEVEVEKVVAGLVDGSVGFTEGEIAMLRIVADPPAFATNDVEFAMRLSDLILHAEDDIEQRQTTTTAFIAQLLEQTGYPALAQTYRTAMA